LLYYNNKMLKTPEEFIECSVGLIKINSPTVKPSTISTYSRLFRKLYTEIIETDPDVKLHSVEIPIPTYIFQPDLLVNLINNSTWGVGLKDQTRKNYISLILTLFRGLKDINTECLNAYSAYREYFDILKGGLDAEQIKQKPTENEMDLKGLTIDKLKKALSKHSNKIRKSDSKDINTAMLNMLGHLHCEEVLRNEACDMMLSNKYITAIDAPDLNFIWYKGRNLKLMVIRNNKVRNPTRGDEPKEVWIKGSLNTAINKYIQILQNNDITYNDRGVMPLVYSKSYPNCITSSHYSQLFKKVWDFQDLELTTTMVRKIYAIEIREKFKGNLIKEDEACKKLDHSKDTHDKHYILDFS